MAIAAKIFPASKAIAENLAAPGYPLQVLIPLRSIVGFPLLSLLRIAPVKDIFGKEQILIFK